MLNLIQHLVLMYRDPEAPEASGQGDKLIDSKFKFKFKSQISNHKSAITNQQSQILNLISTNT